MTIFDFLRELNEFFPMEGDADTIKKKIGYYTEILEKEIQKTGKKYDFKKIIQHLLKTYNYKKFPSFASILEALPCGEINDYAACHNEGTVVVITCPNGYNYQFVVSNFGKPIDLIKNEINRKFKGCVCKFYPKGTVIADNTVILPN